ncbi:oxidoreductase [Streptomyces sp. PBH53]|uniref:NmrA family NAD(P)-binding protein n=1 Tax=Streptomyces sp. PBH53 TaxID=1577075 RepID=UPI000654D15B|nr:NmrA family NAD(P)-binding protein [Streptomyces sp. PBH53]AKN68456.1 oxidoreductase [Streptomyces sp. PBH53]
MSPASGSGTTLVIGATGTTGSRTAARLAAAGHPVRAASRRAVPVAGADPVRFDWYDPASFDPALTGADRVYLVPPVGDPAPAAVMLPFLERARAHGVRRAVLLSSSAIAAGGPAVGAVHEALPGLFGEWAVLRPSWFMQNFTGAHAHATAIREEGVIRSATGTGRVGFIDADDIAAVAATVLTDDRAPDTDLILTGPETLSYDDIARICTETTGRRVTHHRLTAEQLRDHLTETAGLPAAFAAMLASLDHAIADGAEDRVTTTVHDVTGRPPHTFREVLHRETATRTPTHP